MACYKPVRAFQDETGAISFSEVRFASVRSLELPCGWCIGCRLERRRQWAVRCMHEARLHEENAFVTLTYNDENVPQEGLRYMDFQLFMKRLRHHAGPLRFYMCGEYGEQFSRPHYHACLFGYGFPDKRYLCTRDGNKVYRSPLLESLWSFGFSSIGEVNYTTASYVAGYIVDKVVGDKAEEHYAGRVPEFNRMSLKPGIGAGWFERYSMGIVQVTAVHRCRLVVDFVFLR